MTCGINCKQRTYTVHHTCSTLLDVIEAVFEDRGHGDMTVQIFPDGSGEVSFDDGPVVGIFENGSWRLKNGNDINISQFPPEVNDDVKTHCCCGLELLLELRMQKRALENSLHSRPEAGSVTSIFRGRRPFTNSRITL